MIKHSTKSRIIKATFIMKNLLEKVANNFECFTNEHYQI